jgi:hypothetical protein
MAYRYCTATNFGKGFFTHKDRERFFLRGEPGNVWIVGDNSDGVDWIGRQTGVSKTKAEAQAIVDGEIETAQTAYDALSAEEQARNVRPVKYNIV